MRSSLLIWPALGIALAAGSAAALPADRAATSSSGLISRIPSSSRSTSVESPSNTASKSISSKSASTTFAAPSTSNVTNSNGTIVTKDAPPQASACTAFAAYLPTLLSSGKATPGGTKLKVKNSLAAYYQGVNPSTKELIDLIPDGAFGPKDSKKGAINGAGEWDTTDVMMDKGYGEADLVEQAALGLLPPFCRIGGSIETSDSSQTWFEVWLPLPRDGLQNGTFGDSSIAPNISSPLVRVEPLILAKTWRQKDPLVASSSSTPVPTAAAFRSENPALQHVLARSDSPSLEDVTAFETALPFPSAALSPSAVDFITSGEGSTVSDSPSAAASSVQPLLPKVVHATSKKPDGLPASGGNWRGRMLLIGTGGQKGTVIYPELKQVLTRYREAAAGTNAGHWGSGSDTTWTIQSPESQNDFGYRGVHVSTLASKAVVSQFYGAKSFGTDRANTKDATGLTFRSYFKGCSTGGRQAMVSAQRYPQDFDGIMAGSPAIDYNYLNAYQIHVNSFQNDTSSPRYIPEELYATIHEAALNQCDAMDGQMDGIIGDVFNCDPHDYVPRLACDAQESVAADSTIIPTIASESDAVKLTARSRQAKLTGNNGLIQLDNITSSDTPSCLTQPQIDNLYDIYETFKIGDTLIHEPVLPGSETGWTVLDGVGGVPFPAAPGWFKYQVLNITDKNAAFNPYTQVTPDVIFQGQQADAGGTIGFNTNLRPYFQKGGKLVHYHGLADQLIPSGSSFRYHKLVTNNYSRFSSSYKFFPIPGMNHCRSGDGAFNFGSAGQTDQAGWRPLSYDANHDLTLALFKWVEQGTAPTSIIGAAYKNSTTETIGSYSSDVLAPRPFQNGVKLTRRFCPWPKTAQLVDNSRRGVAEGYKCQ
ncbi:Tannase/feruloyl esterase [Ceraceosorus bombacis]|uniref:Carboxylic ester hydrolase n=1 Tax=Ceraceosorus bombacis TaxID=401625 RepID=A0A0P1BGX9_9BASI|nr:Tannase/feruloyl esterase [Ceraceosorus bombacis]